MNLSIEELTKPPDEDWLEWHMYQDHDVVIEYLVPHSCEFFTTDDGDIRIDGSTEEYHDAVGGDDEVWCRTCGHDIIYATEYPKWW